MTSKESVLAHYPDIRVEELWATIRCRSYDVRLSHRFSKMALANTTQKRLNHRYL